MTIKDNILKPTLYFIFSHLVLLLLSQPLFAQILVEFDFSSSIKTYELLTNKKEIDISELIDLESNKLLIQFHKSKGMTAEIFIEAILKTKEHEFPYDNDFTQLVSGQVLKSDICMTIGMVFLLQFSKAKIT